MKQRSSILNLRALAAWLCVITVLLGLLTCVLAGVIEDHARSSRVFWAGIVMVVFALAVAILSRWRRRQQDVAKVLVDILRGVDRRSLPWVLASIGVVLAAAGGVAWWLRDARTAWLMLHPAWVAGLTGALVELDRRQSRRQAFVMFALYSEGQCDELTRAAIDELRAGNPEFDAAIHEHLAVLSRCKKGL